MNFNIVDGEYENTRLNKIYNDFEKDFLNPETTVSGLKQKYSLSYGEYIKIMHKVKKENGIDIKPNKFHKNPIIDNPRKYIHIRQNRFVIVKKINGQIKTFGYYKELSVAQKIRDRLIECGWDKTLLKQIREEMEK